jgi:hypothetical protein
MVLRTRTLDVYVIKHQNYISLSEKSIRLHAAEAPSLSTLSRKISHVSQPFFPDLARIV